MQCSYYQQQICRSCSQLHLSYPQTLENNRDVLAGLFPEHLISDFRAMPSAEGSRIRGRLAVTGTFESPLLGFYDDQHEVVPVDRCPLHHPLINEWTGRLPEMIRAARLTPYDPKSDRGELKFVVLTCSPSHRQLMMQFVLRSREAVDRIRGLWRRLTEADRQTLVVMSINLQPVRSSAVSGREEIEISEQSFLPIRFCGNDLFFGPQSFLQTNYEMANELYQSAADAIRKYGGQTVLDLYCGAGAFSLTAATHVSRVLGIDVSPDAIRCARESARRNRVSNAEYQCRSLECTTADQLPDWRFDTIICNPPRRGLDAASLSLIQNQNPQTILYSSCNAITLQRDLQILSAQYRVDELRPFDMFPFTSHFEVLAILQRDGAG